MNNGSNGVASLQARLNEPQTAAAINRLLDRIETLEQTVGRLADALEQAPGMVAMMGDMADETVRQAAARGVNVEERLKTALALADRLTAEETAVKLNNLLDLTDQLPGTLAMMGDMMDETVRRAASSGIDIEARLRAGLTMAEKLTAPEMTAKLDQLLALADQAPGMVAMMGDMVDETVRRAASSGIDIEARLRAGLTMAEKLTAPEMMAKLDQLLALADQAPGMVAMMGDMMDETVRRAASSGIDIEARLRAGLTMAEKLTAPEMMAKLDQLLALADQAPGMMAMMGDIVDESYRRASEAGINIEAMVRQGARAGAKFSALMESEEFDALMESGILDPQAVASVGTVGRALIASQQHPPQSVGLFGLLSAMRDPNMQRALGFLATFGAEFGKQINK
ncbi:MAG: DUF1641 domain-containing protein [Chloroflexota bacterium]